MQSPVGNPPSTIQGHRPDLIVVFVALAVRGWALVDGMDAPTFLDPVVDAQTYDEAARALAAGEGLSHRFFWQPIFYPVFLAAVYVVGSGSILVAKVVQLLLGVATCWLTFRLGRRLLGERSGLLAGLFCALHGPMIFFETELLATGWAAFWTVVLLLRFTRFPGDASRLDWAVTGLLVALATLTRPTFLPACLLVIAMLLWRTPWRAASIRLVFAIGGFAVLALPVALLGAQVAGHASFLPASGTMNFYLGNHPEPCETLTIRPGAEWDGLVGQTGAEHAGDFVAIRTHFAEATRENLGQNPGALPRGLVRKTVQMINGRELPRNVDPYVQREWSGVLSVLMFRVGGFGFPMGLLLPLAFVGAWAARRRLPAVFFVFVAAYLLSVIAVFVSGRYRIPMVPAISILAAAGAVAAARAIGQRRWKEVGLGSLALVVVGLLSWLPGPFCEEEIDYQAETLYAVGYSRHRAGDLDAAASSYSRALTRRPDYVELLNQLGVLRRQQGRIDEAIELWTRAVRIDPTNVMSRSNLGRAFTMQERHGPALEQYQAVLRLQPKNANALMGKGLALLGLGRFEEAVGSLEKALQHEPDFAPRLGGLIEGLRRVGEKELAARLHLAIQRAVAWKD